MNIYYKKLTKINFFNRYKSIWDTLITTHHKTRFAFLTLRGKYNKKVGSYCYELCWSCLMVFEMSNLQNFPPAYTIYYAVFSEWCDPSLILTTINRLYTKSRRFTYKTSQSFANSFANCVTKFTRLRYSIATNPFCICILLFWTLEYIFVAVWMKLPFLKFHFS